jgi:hypothetical protein
VAHGESDSEVGVPAGDAWDEAVSEDPFVLFLKWASAAGERAYAEFVPTPRAPR